MKEYAPKDDGNDPLAYAKHIAEATSAVGEGAVTLNTLMKDITSSPARKKAMYDYIDKQEGHAPGTIIRIDKDDYLFSAPEGWSPKERVESSADSSNIDRDYTPEIPSQGWGDVFSRDDANYEIADNLAESLISRTSADVASWNPENGLDDATAAAWRNAASRTRLVEKIKESIDEQNESVVSTGYNPEERSVHLIFESGTKLTFDATGNKMESTKGLNQSSPEAPGNNPAESGGEYDYDDEDEYTYSSFYPGR